MKIEGILKELKYYNGILPKEELYEAIKQKEAITPYLIEMLDYTLNNLNNILNETDHFYGYTYAIFLLAEFKEKKLFPYLIELMKKGENTLDYIIGDDFPEFLSRLLASSYNGDDDTLISIIKDKNIDQFVRCCALRTYDILYLEKVKDRDYLINLLKDLINSHENEKNYLYDEIIDEIINLKLVELQDETKKIYNNVLHKDVFEGLKEMIDSKDYTINRYVYPLFEHYEYIHDIVDIMDKWQCFRYEEDEEFGKSYNYMLYEKIVKKRNNQKNDKVGRNDPCPCGSRKKYKKCCLNTISKDNKTLNILDYHIAKATWYAEKNMEIKACDCYRMAQFSVIDLCKENNIKTIFEYDHKYDCYDFFSNWIQDYLMMLGNNWDKINLQYDRIFTCDQIEKTFKLDDENSYWKEMIIREKSNALFIIGKEEEATNLVEEYLKEKPEWIWGYIEMADWYSFKKDEKYNPQKAIEILEKTLLLDIPEDMDAVYERLVDLYEDIGKKEKSQEYRIKRDKYLENK